MKPTLVPAGRYVPADLIAAIILTMHAPPADALPRVVCSEAPK
jgi:hypothetical protein